MEIDEVPLNVRDGEELDGRSEDRSDSSFQYALQMNLFSALAEQFPDVLEVGGIRAVPFMQVL